MQHMICKLHCVLLIVYFQSQACEEHAAMMAEMEDDDEEVTYGEAMTSASQISGMLHQ